MNKIINKNQSIAIIGAGPAGLSAAEALKERGYHHVTVFEKLNRVGGQSYSPSYITPDGHKIPYELGSLSPTSSKILNQLIQRYHMHFTPLFDIRRYSIEQHKYIFDAKKYAIGYPMTLRNLWLFLHDISILLLTLFKYRAILHGFSALSEKQYKELSIPYEEWLDHLGLTLLQDDVKFLFCLTMTYAHPEESKYYPAMLAVRLMWTFMKFPPRYFGGHIKPLQEGYQELWNRVAKNHDVKLHSQIKHIKRDEKIHIELENGDTLEFDHLIITCTPNKAKEFLDCTEQENEINHLGASASGIRLACTAKNIDIDADELRTYVESTKETGTHLMLIAPVYQIDQHTNLYTIAARDDKHNKTSIEDIKSEIEETLKKEYNATDIHWVNQAKWEYGSHYDCAATNKNVYQKIEAIQGQNHTYYFGAMISGHMHATVTEYSYEKVAEYF